MSHRRRVKIDFGGVRDDPEKCLLDLRRGDAGQRLDVHSTNVYLNDPGMRGFVGAPREEVFWLPQYIGGVCGARTPPVFNR